MKNSLQPAELDSAISKLVSICSEMRDHLLSQATDAAQSGETNWLLQVSSDAKEIEACAQKLESIGQRVREVLTITLGFQDDPSGESDVKEMATSMAQSGQSFSGNRRLRHIRTQITQGEINQNLLTLTDARQRSIISVGEQFKLRLPDGEEFETYLMQQGNKLRERGRIRQFYQQQKIQPGDFVVLEEIAAGVWKLSKEPKPVS